MWVVFLIDRDFLLITAFCLPQDQFWASDRETALRPNVYHCSLSYSSEKAPGAS